MASFEGRTTRAAVMRGVDRPVEVEELEIAEPGAHEVLVRMAASGVCHSDLHVLNGDWPAPTPIVLGHEGAGVVERVGPRVESVEVGDPVVLSWLPSCGRCVNCLGGKPYLCRLAPDTVYRHLMPDGTTRLRAGDEAVHSFLTVGSFGEFAVVPESGAMRIEPGVPADQAALVGCAVATGFGAVANTVRVTAATSAAVIGCGGVGLSVIQGCVAHSLGPLIAVDIDAAKLAVAAEFGATHTIDASATDPVAAIAEITDRVGVEFAFDAIGTKATIEGAVRSLAAGGTAVLVGMPAEGVMAEFEPNQLIAFEHKIVGCNYGSCNPPIDFPRLIDLARAGKLDLEAMISARLPLERADAAILSLARGEGIRSVLHPGAEQRWPA
jgi:S-(hydroxymethyl)glutathione dehydrogenase / alcohol dehydrogenase